MMEAKETNIEDLFYYKREVAGREILISFEGTNSVSEIREIYFGIPWG